MTETEDTVWFDGPLVGLRDLFKSHVPDAWDDDMHVRLMAIPSKAQATDLDSLWRHIEESP